MNRAIETHKEMFDREWKTQYYIEDDHEKKTASAKTEAVLDISFLENPLKNKFQKKAILLGF